MTKQAFGYSTFGYWKLFNTEEAAKLLESHVCALPVNDKLVADTDINPQPESVTSLVYPTEPEAWKTNLGPVGAAEAWVSSDQTSSLPAWLSAEEATTHKEILGKKGYTGPLNWYDLASQPKTIWLNIALLILGSSGTQVQIRDPRHRLRSQCFTVGRAQAYRPPNATDRLGQRLHHAGGHAEGSYGEVGQATAGRGAELWALGTVGAAGEAEPTLGGVWERSRVSGTGQLSMDAVSGLSLRKACRFIPSVIYSHALRALPNACCLV